MPTSDSLYKLSCSLGVEMTGSEAVLYDTRCYTAGFLTSLTREEVAALMAWYADGKCPICLEEINTGETVCDSCFQDARSYREQYGY